MPTGRDLVATLRLLSGGRESRFWSESWVSHAALLTELVGVLRASRPATSVDVDEGWRPDRDLSLAVGRWGWLHVSSLVEEHEGGRCLVRIGSRLRLSVVGTLRGVAAALVMAGGTAASMALYRPSVSVVLSAVLIAGIATRAVWQVTRATAVLDQAVSRVTTAMTLVPLGVGVVGDRVLDRTRKTSLSPGEG